MNEHDLNRLENQNRQIRNLVSPGEQRIIDEIEEERNGRILVAVTIITFCVVIIVCFALMCADVIGKLAV